MSPTLRNSSTNFSFKQNLFKISVFVFVQTLPVFGQNPGGIGTGNLRGWYDCNFNVGLTGGNVSTWGDRSGNGLNGSQATAANRPALTTAGMNYHTTLTFDGATDYISIPNQVASTATGVTAFAVARQSGTSGDPFGMILVGQANSTSGTGGGYGIIAASPFNNVHGFAVDDYGGNLVASASTLSEPTLLTGNYNGSTPGNVEYFKNGTSQGTNAYTGQVGNNGSSFIGSAETTGGFCFLGDIAEVIVYNTGLSPANTTRVETYLALKYSLPKAGNYVNTSNTTVYSSTAPYNNGVIGLGRDDNTGLYQKQSRTYDDSCRIFIGTLAATNAANAGTFSFNNQFLVLGHDNQRLSGQLTEKPTTIFSRLKREWKVTNTGFLGTFSFAIRLNTIANTSSLNGAHLRLLVDTDGDFSNATVYNPSITFASNIILVSGITTAQIPPNSTRYITIGSDNSNSPLPIELLSFESLLCDNSVCLNWKTASEKNNDRFEVIRSADGANWQMVTTVKGAGNSYQPLSYEAKDEFPLSGTSYYRLKQFDFDGSSSFSPIVAIDNNNRQHLELLGIPNPANEQVTVDGFKAAEIKVFNMLGQQIDAGLVNESIEERKVRIKTATLPEGIYFISTSNEAVDPSRRVIRIVVKHL